MTAFMVLSAVLACGLEDIKSADSGSTETVDPDTLDEGGDSDGDEDSDDGGGPSDVDGGSGGEDSDGATDGDASGDGGEDAAEGTTDTDGTTGEDGGDDVSGTAGTSDGAASGSDDGTATGSSSGTTTGGTGGDGLGGCVLSGVCSPDMPFDDCAGSDMLWLPDGCPPETGECHDYAMFHGHTYSVDPLDLGYMNDFEPDCADRDSIKDVAYAWTPPTPAVREYCITASVGEGYEDDYIAPVLSVWSDCDEQLHCAAGDEYSAEPSVSITGAFSGTESYIVVIEHSWSSDSGYFDLRIDYGACPESTE